MYDIERFHSERTTYQKVNEQLIGPEITGTVTTQKQLRDFTDLAEHSFKEETVFEHAMSWAIGEYFSDAEEDGIDLAVTNNIANIQDHIDYWRDFVTNEVDPFDDDDFYLQELARLDELTPYIQLLQDTQAIITRGLESPDDHDSRQLFVNDIYGEYAANNSEASQGVLDGDMPSLVDFIKYYHEALETATVQGQFTEKIQNWRSEYAIFLRQRGIAYGSPASSDRAASIVETVPIIIDDPLSTLSRLMHDGEHGELFGMHTPDQRTINVDPFTIAKYTTNELYQVRLVHDIEVNAAVLQHYIDLQFRKTLLHEIIHAYTDSHYYNQVITLTDEDDPELEPIVTRELRTGQQWQKFWREGMTEKIAVLHLSEQLGSNTAAYRLLDYDREVALREARDERYPTQQTMQSERTTELMHGLWSSYSDYRTLIDAMFLKLDWQQAGLSQQEAEQLAITAFLEVPDDTADDLQSSARHAFITAVNEASHPGFFMKLGHLVDHYGAHLSTVMLASDRFDPHSPTATPFVTTKTYKSFVTERAKILDAAVDSLVGMPEAYLAMKQELRDSAMARSALLRDAIFAQGSILEAQYDSTKEANLFRVIFGDDLSHHYDALEKWQQHITDSNK